MSKETEMRRLEAIGAQSTGGAWVRQGGRIVLDLGAQEIEGELQEEVLAAQQVIDTRIDVHAQYALMRMSRNPDTAAAAAAMLAAVKSGRLGGIDKEDQQVPALRARGMGLGWWQLLQRWQDATVVFDRNPASAPLLVFRDSVRSIPSRLDPALLGAWTALTRIFSGGFPVLVRHPVKDYVWVSHPGLAPRSPLRTVAALAPLPPPTPLAHIGNTTQVPNRWICHLEMDFGPDTTPPIVMGRRIKAQATGFLIGRRHVLTAGHCLVTHFGPKVDVLGSPIAPINPVSVTVTPAFNVNRTPFGKLTVAGTAVRASARWVSSNATDESADFGLITLSQPFDPPVEFWSQQNTRIAFLTDQTLKGKKLTCAGYPGNKCPPVVPFPLICPQNGFLGTSQWGASGSVVTLTADNLEYLIESNSGLSGSPVWLDDGKLLHLAGIHTKLLASPPGVRAAGVRITGKLLQEVRGWMKADKVTPTF
jgi:V8-like Glu-specific endopeptidase